MAERPSLGRRLRDELRDDLTVSVISVFLGLLAFGLVTASSLEDGGLFVAVTIAVFVPWTYGDQWPESYSPAPAAVWTVSAALVTAGLYVGSYAIFDLLVTSQFVPAGAFVVTVLVQQGIARLLGRIRTRR